MRNDSTLSEGFLILLIRRGPALGILLVTLVMMGTMPAYIPLGCLILLLVGLVVFGRVPLRYNLRNLVVRWPITLLTGFAFTAVVALVTVMMAFVGGMYRLTAGSAQPGNVIVLSDGATDEAFSNLSYSDTSDVERQPGVLRDEQGRPLCSKEVYIIVNQPIPGAGPGERKKRFTQVRGIEEPEISGRVHGLALQPGGRWFAPSGVPEAVLGEGIARELGRDRQKPTLEVGDTFELGDRAYTVCGIMRSAGTTFDSEIWAKRESVGKRFGKENPSTLVLGTANAEEAARVAADVTTNFKKAALQARTEADYYESLNGTNQQFLYAFIVIAVILAVGGVFGVMNTMFAAISQRSKDIGVLRILGFSGWQLLVSFLLESLLLAVLGGLLGCALGSLANGWSATSIIGSGAGGGKSVVLKLVVDGNTLATGFLFTLIMGGLGGLLPALAAMRLKPLEAVR